MQRASKNLELIQVTQNLPFLKTHEREIRALRQGADKLKLRRLTVITLNTEGRLRENGAEITVISCRKRLTARSYLGVRPRHIGLKGNRQPRSVFAISKRDDRRNFAIRSVCAIQKPDYSFCKLTLAKEKRSEP